MKFLLILFSSMMMINCTAQEAVFNRVHHHFGTMMKNSERFTDFVLTNKTGKKIFILRAASDKDVVSMISEPGVLPDSSSTIRIQFNPKETGRFSRQIAVYLSHLQEPVLLTISGEVRELPDGNDLACPDFKQVSVASVPDFILEIEVLDNLTGEPVKNAEIKIIYTGLVRYEFTTPASGHVSKKIPIGYYYFVTTADDYLPDEFDAYVNSKTGKLTIYLNPVIHQKIDPHPDDSLFYVSMLPPIKDPGKPKDSIVNSEKPVMKEKPVEIPVADSGAFTLNTHRANNIVFLVDISGSMLEDGKLELLKTSMIELTNMLRDVDHISVIVFASNARVVLENVPGNQKQEVIAKIQSLEGGGNTAGSEGMLEAYRVAMKHFIPGGNNVVIMATDGAFNLYTTDVGSLVKKYKKKGITTSVLGIKNKSSDMNNMQYLAGLGGGKYIQISNFGQAVGSLTEEIRRSSKIN
jgi:Ca-activated chloride channel homolog